MQKKQYRYNNATLYHFGCNSCCTFLLIQYFILVLIIALQIDEAELEKILTWEVLGRFLLYTFFIIALIDSFLFRVFFRFTLSIGFGMTGYFYAAGCCGKSIEYTIGVFIFIILLAINFAKKKTIYDF